MKPQLTRLLTVLKRSALDALMAFNRQLRTMDIDSALDAIRFWVPRVGALSASCGVKALRAFTALYPALHFWVGIATREFERRAREDIARVSAGLRWAKAEAPALQAYLLDRQRLADAAHFAQLWTRRSIAFAKAWGLRAFSALRFSYYALRFWVAVAARTLKQQLRVLAQRAANFPFQIYLDQSRSWIADALHRTQLWTKRAAHSDAARAFVETFSAVRFWASAAAMGLALMAGSSSATSTMINTIRAPDNVTRPRDPAAPTFVDYFHTLDESRWSISDGWSNGDWMSNNFKRSQLSITPEGLAITLARDPNGGDKKYAGGEIQTRQRFQYGYFEARMRIPRGNGMVIGLFTFARPRGADSWDEIDMEITGRRTRRIELSYWTRGHVEGKKVPLDFDAADDFHTYGIEWRPDSIRYYIDNQLVLVADGSEQAIPQGPQQFIVDLWISEKLHKWVGPIHSEDAPWVLTVSCMAQAPHYTGHSICQAERPAR